MDRDFRGIYKSTAVLVDVVDSFELMHADDLVLMTPTMEHLRRLVAE